MLSILALVATLNAVQAPERFIVRLETTKGAIVIECVRAWHRTEPIVSTNL